MNQREAIALHCILPGCSDNTTRMGAGRLGGAKGSPIATGGELSEPNPINTIRFSHACRFSAPSDGTLSSQIGAYPIGNRRT